jgi:ABC-type enterochelin transport system substrate-binding protein
MNYFKIFFLLLLASIALTAQAQTRQEQTNEAQATTQVRQIEQSTTKQATFTASPSQGSPNKIKAAPGGVLTLCCGNVDPHEQTGSNCAYMHTGQACGGQILACPEGTDDTVKKDGSGYCKSGG